MRKYKILHKDRHAIYQYFVDRFGETNKFILTILYYEKVNSASKNEEIILSFKVKNIFGETEAEVLSRANDWVKDNLGENFTVIETT